MKTKVEERIQTSKERFSALANSIIDAIININSDGNIVFWNRAAEEIFGFSKKEMIDHPLDQIMPQEFQQAHIDGVKRVVLTGKTRIIGKIVEIIGVKKSGKKFPIELSLATWKIDEEIFFTAIIRDITDRKQLEEKIRLDSQMLTNINDGILLNKVSDGKIVYTNNQFEKMFGYGTGELLGKPVSILNSSTEKASDVISKEISESFLLNGIWEGEIQNVKKDGSTFWSYASISGFTHSGYGEVLVTVQQDISARKQARLELTHLSTHDSLTGLHNRTFFDEEMDRLKRGRRFPVSIIMADIDGLKITNDTFGHSSGDLLLQRAASVLAKSFRGEDMVARIGGDEFVALLPNTDAEAVKKVLKRIQNNIHENNLENNEVKLEISFGTDTAEHGQDLVIALKQADKNMYKQKKKHEME